ncbi:1,4-alpha-glucan (glycogen) branching enzyme, GH-13-type [Rhodovulum sp. P5]|uniref:1,4-alpha-glucan branching protein GlgB n=1 Tax=Rhodovulum sp. P5 TaxID=1564506 RepID=UPI0009C1B748|nr:1,4-alpha-glucan branching protein GlgB [Rhodovulum sp. P5]ARE38534.1 1,4-alpha-glucan (glycogen) branching enzyme, GH-13-type [Rhodovulum sp. P5]
MTATPTTQTAFPSPSDARRLQEGTHDDPFAVLGPHVLEGVRHVVAFLPGLAALHAVVGKECIALTRHADAPDLFSGPVPGQGAYTLSATDGAGTSWDFEDPYRFGPVIGEMDEYLLGEGTHRRLWQVLGAHTLTHEGVQGTHFAVWAPNALRVSVVGPFNNWDGRRHPMRRRGTTGVWELFLPGIVEGECYKYEILGQGGNVLPLKADPVGFGAEHPPRTASVVRDISGYGWHDTDWMDSRTGCNARTAPISVYEVHLGSWKRIAQEGNRPLSYKEAAEELVDYVADMGFTHIEFLPLSEHPFDGSWGYQPVGLFAPTIRHGPPHEFRDLIDAAHRKGLGVILDWVPAHFPTDAHGLGQFDGTALYEHADPREGFHHDWNTLIYNYGRTEVANFLYSNALFWLEEYHIDGLRVDAVASMLYRDYSRKEGEWIPNRHGGRENLEAIAMLQTMNTVTYGEVPGIMTVAEESTSFPGVSQPVDTGGLGFGYKWNMGWMNDTLDYFAREPVHRKFHHHQLTFGLLYAFSENFILPISHDEVVHGKGSMLSKMPGPDWEQFANLRAYYGFMWGHPGKKLLFMGQEFAQRAEWDAAGQLDWGVLGAQWHAGVQRLVRDLNTFYRATPALHVKDCEGDGFQWIEANAGDISVYAWQRKGGPDDPPVVVIANLTPVERPGYRLGLPRAGRWRETLNTDAAIYGGGNRGNMGGITATDTPHQAMPASAEVTLPPLSVLYLMPEEA